MAKVLFRVSYTIPDGKRPEYLTSINAVKDFYAGSGITFDVFESKGKRNHFQEVYVYASEEAYEASDDPETTAPISGAIEKIYGLAKDVVYDVSIEVV